MTIAVMGAIGVPIALAFLALALVWPADAKFGRGTLLKLSLAVPIGLGLSSVGFFLWLAAFGVGTTGLFALEIAAFLVLLVIAIRGLAKREARRNACRRLTNRVSSIASPVTL